MVRAFFAGIIDFSSLFKVVCFVAWIVLFCILFSLRFYLFILFFDSQLSFFSLISSLFISSLFSLLSSLCIPLLFLFLFLFPLPFPLAFVSPNSPSRLVHIYFHITVLATGSADHTVKLWDIDAGEEKVTLTGNTATLQDMQWNYDGSMIATSCKDKMLRIFDARTDAVVQECKPHEGSKCFKTCWLGQSNNIVTVGFTRQSKRQFLIWDHRDLSKAIHTESLDQSAGVIMPFYDEDSKVMYLAGKGDGNIRFYEMVPEKPHCFALSEYRGNHSQKGIAFIPKRHCDTTKCEVMRAIKLTSNSAEPLSFIIPRKSDRFQADIFPDTKGGVPALEATDFFGGATGFTPKLVSMDPKNKSASGETKQSMPSSIKTKGALQKELTAALARIAELEAEVAKLKA
jgi:WD40 repeat protein